MATITPVINAPISGVASYTWETVTENDTASAVIPAGSEPIFGSIQFTGTFGGATGVLQGSNDASNWVTLKDPNGTAVSTTAVGAFEFSTAMTYLRPSFSAGTSQDVDVVMVLRG